jgi:hypothetical protein
MQLPLQDNIFLLPVFCIFTLKIGKINCKLHVNHHKNIESAVLKVLRNKSYKPLLRVHSISL